MQAAKLTLLGHISSVLGVQLNPIKEPPYMEVVGPDEIDVEFMLGIPLTMKVTPLGVLAGPQYGVMVRLAGDLHVFPVYNSSTEAFTVYVLDGSKYTDKGVPMCLGSNLGSRYIREVITDFREALVAAFFLRDGQWRQLKLPL